MAVKKIYLAMIDYNCWYWTS